MEKVSKTDTVSMTTYRCWSHRWCDCTYAEDCRLTGVLPVHDDQPCGGVFADDGFRPHCTGAAS